MQVKSDLLTFAEKDGGHGAVTKYSKLHKNSSIIVTKLKPLIKHIARASAANYHDKFIYFTGGTNQKDNRLIVYRTVFAYDLKS